MRVDLVGVDGKGTVGRLVAPLVRQIILRGARAMPTPRIVAGLGALKAYLARERPAVLMAGSNRAHIVAALACAAMPDPPSARTARGAASVAPFALVAAVEAVARIWAAVDRAPAFAAADLIIAVSQESAAAIARLVDRPGQGHFHPQSDNYRALSRLARHARRSSLVRRGRSRGRSGRPWGRADQPAEGFRDAGRGGSRSSIDRRR